MNYNNQSSGQVDAFGQPVSQVDAFGQPMSQDPFGMEQTQQPAMNQDMFGGQYTTPTGWVSQGDVVQEIEEMEQPQKWWQKGIRVVGIASVGVLLFSILGFGILHGLNNSSQEKNSSEEQPSSMAEQPQEQTNTSAGDTSVVDNSKWQVIGNTEGFTYNETIEGYFIVQGTTLYVRSYEGGIQTKHVVYGNVLGFPGVFEVDVPRTAERITEIRQGFEFRVLFDVYTSTDGKTRFIENIRPDSKVTAE